MWLLTKSGVHVQGVRGMRIGGQRKLIIPPELAYGKKGIREVPPDATLEFEVIQLIHLAIKPAYQSITKVRELYTISYFVGMCFH